MQALAILIEFFVLLACVCLAVAAIFVITGLALQALNARHPQRRIQQRRSLPRGKELRQAPYSILTLSFWYSLGLFAQAKGLTIAPVGITWWNLGPLLLGSIILYDAWFYWVHRLMHLRTVWPVHALHHRSHAPTAWSNNSDSVLDSTLCQLYFAVVPFVLPLPAAVLVVHKVYDQVSGMIGHCGHEHSASRWARAPWPLASTLFHDLHHAKIGCNFAHSFTLWDRWMGTLHPQYDAMMARCEAEMARAAS